MISSTVLSFEGKPNFVPRAAVDNGINADLQRVLVGDEMDLFAGAESE